ncbi:MDR family MFS transporter [Paenibacillus hunanensis]|uniref:EmrB/QacA subfamily drug resistance transporter n=1 Tax=Paenibacillus hunanensis TaxID=539262 RepID=A0ABU1ITA2_9BACL|nr:MDR family MFS transporter [Paenibacillus hunanensis]MCL9659955.1 multidrug efflux MFS transporter [Paenibacillus hunanensis]MDR6242492.1 EmrB/QacA subfamily drug resistance transporter [Paenibacillus hunanensis]GGJ08230.1 putative MFS-type transporter YcnB [Paenibacillus hunanensis]
MANTTANPVEEPRPKVNIKVIVGIMLAGAFVAILNQTLLVTALPHIMRDLKIDATAAQWLTTIFMLVNGIMIPITAYLIDKFNTRALFITSIGLFALGTLIAAISPTFGVLLVGRVIQAAGAGIVMPLMQTVFLVIFPKESRGAAMGMIGLVISFAPAIGPTLSGWVVDTFSWRDLFYIILPIALIDLVIAIFALKNVGKLRDPKLDMISVVLSTIGFGGLLYGFSTASKGWNDPTVLITIAIGAVSLILFVRRQFKLEQPLLEFRVFKDRLFTISMIITVIVFTAMIGASTLLPLYIQNARHLSAVQSGLIVLPGAILMGIMSPITGRIFDKIGAKTLGVTGLALLLIGTVPFTMLSDQTPVWLIMVMFAMRMLGLSMVMMPVTTAGLNQLPTHLLSHATAMNNTLRQVGGSIGTAVLITVFTNASASAAMSGKPADLSMIHGTNMAFMVASILSAAALVMIFFLKEPPRRDRQSGTAEATKNEGKRNSSSQQAKPVSQS